MKRTRVMTKPVDTPSDGKHVQIVKEHVGMYEGLRSPKHIATLREQEAEQLLESLQEVVVG